MTNDRILNFIKNGLPKWIRKKIEDSETPPENGSIQGINTTMNPIEIKPKSNFIRYYALGIMLLIIGGILWSMNLPSEAGMMGIPILLICLIYAPTLLPLGIVSYLIKDRKTAITLNIIMTVLLF
jgi:hypothetical protein